MNHLISRCYQFPQYLTLFVTGYRIWRALARHQGYVAHEVGQVWSQDIPKGATNKSGSAIAVDDWWRQG